MTRKTKEDPVAIVDSGRLIGASAASYAPAQGSGRGPGRPKTITDEERDRIGLAELGRIKTCGGTILPEDEDDPPVVNAGGAYAVLEGMREEGLLSQSNSRLRKIARDLMSHGYVQTTSEGHRVAAVSSVINDVMVIRRAEEDQQYEKWCEQNDVRARMPSKPGKLKRGRPKNS